MSGDQRQLDLQVAKVIDANHRLVARTDARHRDGANVLGESGCGLDPLCA